MPVPRPGAIHEHYDVEASSEIIFIFEHPVAKWDLGCLGEKHVIAGPLGVGSNFELAPLLTKKKHNMTSLTSLGAHVADGKQQLAHTPSLHTATSGGRCPKDLTTTIGQVLGRKQELPSNDVSRPDVTTATDYRRDDDDTVASDRSWRLDSARFCQGRPDSGPHAAATAAATVATTTTTAAIAAAASGNPSQATLLQPSTPGFLRPRVHAALTAALEAIGVQAATISSRGARR
jgi:hypothetical protein